MAQQVQSPTVDDRDEERNRAFQRQLSLDFVGTQVGSPAPQSAAPRDPPRVALEEKQAVPADAPTIDQIRQELEDEAKQPAVPGDPQEAAIQQLEQVDALTEEELKQLQETFEDIKEQEAPGITGLPGIPRRPEDFDAEKLLRAFDDKELGVVDDPGFSVGGIQSALGTVIDPHTGLTAEMTPEERARAIGAVVSTVIADGFAFAQRSGDPNAGSRVLATIAVGIRNFREGLADDEVGDQLQQTLDLIVGRLLPEASAERPFEEIGIEELTRLPSLTVNAKQLDTASLGPDNIRAIQREFGRDIIAQRLNQQDLLNLSRWVESHVANGALRSVLQETLLERTKHLKPGSAGSRRGVTVESPTTIRIVQSPAQLRDLFDPLESALKDLKEEADDEKETRGRKSVGKRSVTDFVGNVNRTLLEAGFTDAKNVPIAIRVDGRKSVVNQLVDLERQIKDLQSERVHFRIATLRSRGAEADRRDIARILAQVNRFPARSARKDVGRITHPSDILTFGKSKLIKVKLSSDERGLYEIMIAPMTPLEDVIKLAAALVKEPGTLENLHGGRSIEVKKGDDIHKIARWLQTAFLDASGTDTHIIYRTMDPAGGLHVGGALRHAYAKPLFHVTDDRSAENIHRLLDRPLISTTHFGGMINLRALGRRPAKVGGAVKLSDIAGGVASVAGPLSVIPALAPISLPIAAVGSVIKGLGSIFGF